MIADSMKSNLPYLNPKWIDRQALQIVSSLQQAGYETYVVGGCVRDLLLGIQPKDFDIVTEAKPSEIVKVVPRAYIIGKRFRLVLCRRQAEQYEIATFRKNLTSSTSSESNEDDGWTKEEKLDGQHLPDADNEFGTPEEDALRRDFTINGLFYDPVKDKLIDFSNGMNDLNARSIRMIGDPDVRLVEDPIRILRGLRLAHKIGFTLEPDLELSMRTKANHLVETVLPRRREEFLKFLRLPDPSMVFLKSFDLDVFKYSAPTLHSYLERPESDVFFKRLRELHASGVDKNDASQLFGMLMWCFVRAFLSPDPDAPLKARQLEANPDLLEIMSNELGLFKAEQALFMRAIQMQTTLKKTNDFQNKGERRRFSVVRSDYFPMGLIIAARDRSVPLEDLIYWQGQFEEFLPKLVEEDRERASRQRRRRPRKARIKGM
ncbi:MAG: poly(A) polymerase [Bdellovibrionaceae bacterium]|nr:poly(A) polymerase [Pseudobdellovibrionaceae bacterium]